MTTADKVLTDLNQKIDDANTQRRGLINACRATLLSHSASPWDADKSLEWKLLTGSDEATTRVLCDFVREQLGKAVEL